MITDAIMDLLCNTFDKLFVLLPIPQTPAFIDNALTFIIYWIGKGSMVISWLFPEQLWHTVIGVCLSCLTVRFAYDLYIKFFKRKAPV